MRALEGVDLDVYGGEVHAICGENGAGKSTLMAIFAGSLAPDAGHMTLGEEQVYSPANPAEATAAGVSIVYQERSLMPNLSVAENICLATDVSGSRVLADRHRMREASERVLAELDPSIDPDRLVSSYGVAQQQVIEIAKAEVRHPHILILDEPTASITAEAKDRLFRILSVLRGRGLAILYISHHLDEVFQVADRVTVLRNGRGVGTWPVDSIDEGALVAAMVGRSLRGGRLGGAERPSSPPVLRVSGLGRDGEFEDITFEVGAGEIVALAGLVGAGRSEVGETIFGVRVPDRGTVEIGGRKLQPGDPRAAVDSGLCMMTEDRKEAGLFMTMPIWQNIAAPNLLRLSRGPLVDDRRSRALAERQMASLRIRASSPDAPVETLSGGNQQKVLLAMWLATEPKVLVVDEPTKGVDVGAKDEIHHILEGLAEAGTAVLIISSDQREVRRLAHRVLVMRKGQIVASLPGGATEEEVVAYASGAKSVQVA